MSTGSSLESEASAPSSPTSYGDGELELSIWHIAEIFLAQDNFAELCQTGFHGNSTVNDRFTRNLRRMFKTFGKALTSESQSYTASLAGKLVLRDSRRVTGLIRARYDPSYVHGSSHVISERFKDMSHDERRSRVQRFIDEVEATPAKEASSLQHHDSGADHNDSEDSDAEDGLGDNPHDEALTMSSLEEIERLVPSSKAFGALLDSLTVFLRVSKHPRNLSPTGHAQKEEKEDGECNNEDAHARDCLTEGFQVHPQDHDSGEGSPRHPATTIEEPRVAASVKQAFPVLDQSTIFSTLR